MSETWEAGEAIVAALAAGGVERLFFTSGSDILALQEAVAKRTALGLPTPRLVTMLHEAPALNAALGYSMVSSRPSALAAHVDVGMLNAGAALHTARRNGHPIVLLAGAPATAAHGTMRGALDHPVFWLQEPRDLRETMRGYVKWSWRLQLQDDPVAVIARALQVAASPPAGPVLVTLPREVVLAHVPAGPVDAVAQAGIARPAHPDPGAVAALAAALARAECPVIVTGASGRHPRTVAQLAELAETAGAWIAETDWRERLNVPSRHPLLETGPGLAEADVVVVVERAVPWVAGSAAGPPPTATVAWLAQDPIAADVPVHGFPGDLRITCDPYAGITALLEALRAAQTDADRERATARLDEARRRREASDAQLEEAAAAAATAIPIEPRHVASELAALIDDDAILLDESVSSAPLLRAYHRGSRPGSWFAQSGSGGGWGSGAALGAKLAAPERDVVLVSGDGFYGFGVPSAALWSAQQERAPYLAVVLVNGRYSTGTRSADALYPGGYTAQAGYHGGVFEPPPDFAAEARAAGAFGERVDDPAEVRGALRRALDTTRTGTPAVVAVVVA